MTIAEIQQEILRMKKEKDICILAHAYQGQEILEVADYTGDSYGLSVQASKRDCSGVIMCGVRFMAETCKILSPEKRVWLANPAAGCPMAEQLDLESLRELKAQYPDHAVVAYINTTSELKTECDVCVTSSSAVEICRKLEQDKILFIPDPNLGHYVAEKLHREFIIGTENSIVEHLQFACPDKKFYPVTVQLTCMNMKVTTLMDIYNCLRGEGGEEIFLQQDVMEGAGRCIHRMVELGG